MNLAIMQPYLFPYVGYFQLLAAVDKLVFYDDVNFIKNGWINRNRLVLSGAVRYFTVPLLGASPFRRITDISVQLDPVWRRKMLDSIRQSYSKAPHFTAVFPMVEQALGAHEKIAEIAKASVATVAKYLGLPARFEWTSSVYGNEALTGQERVLDICQRESARRYYNLPGGRALYDASAFAERGMELHFVEVKLPEYAHGSARAPAGLSILDLLMWRSPEAALEMIRAEASVTTAADA